MSWVSAGVTAVATTAGFYYTAKQGVGDVSRFIKERREKNKRKNNLTFIISHPKFCEFLVEKIQKENWSSFKVVNYHPGGTNPRSGKNEESKLFPYEDVHHFFKFGGFKVEFRQFVKKDEKRKRLIPYEVEFSLTKVDQKTSDRFRKTLDELFKQWKKAMKNEVQVFEFDEYSGGWVFVSSSRSRKIETVFLKKNVRENLVDDVKRFLGEREKYEKDDTPYRRGYLLHGSAGSGKTSIIWAISGKFQLPIHKLDIQNLPNDKALKTAFNKLPFNCIVLMEDVDNYFCGKRTILNKKISMATLLNCIDGISSPTNYMLFMTTNHRKKLDKAFIRNGRIDREIEIDFPDNYQIIQLYLHYFRSIVSRNFSFKNFERYRFSMAFYQEEFRKYRNELRDEGKQITLGNGDEDEERKRVEELINRIEKANSNKDIDENCISIYIREITGNGCFWNHLALNGDINEYSKLVDSIEKKLKLQKGSIAKVYVSKEDRFISIETKNDLVMLKNGIDVVYELYNKMDEESIVVLRKTDKKD